MRSIPRPAFAGVVLFLVACGGGSAPAQPSPQEAAAKDSPFKPYSEVLKDTEAHEGLFKTHVKRDNTLFMEIAPEQLDTDFGMVIHYSKGVGVYNAHDGLPRSGAQLMRFERHGDKLYLVHRNTRFTADAGSAMLNSLEDNVGHSIVAAFDVKAQEDSTEALVIDVTSFFVSDYTNIGNNLKRYYGNKPVSFDKGRSYLSTVMAFPENVEIDAALTFKANDPPVASRGAGVSDFRSIPIGVRYSLFALPEEPMMPRVADDRVGHFLTAMRDFSRDREPTPMVRFVNRWRLEKADPTAAVSEPVEPVVYYIDRSVPDEYRGYVRDGIEAWNKAYEAAGFRNAIVAKDAPDDPDWSAEDARYSTVRWTAAHEMGYAIGPSQVDPRTGEILNADILISSIFVTGWANEYAQQIGPLALAGTEAAAAAPFTGGLWGRMAEAQAYTRSLPGHIAEYVCLAEMGKAHQLGFQHAAMAALGRIDGTSPMPDAHLAEMLKDLIMHEVGHTLGLRHNFRASSAISWDKLNDKQYTRENGLAVSVMDYNPANIQADESEQGFYSMVEVGSYDVWAIRYAYTPIYEDEGKGALSGTDPVANPEDERDVLLAIASEATKPLHAYNTDEDTHLGPLGVDPYSNTWDLSADPLAYARDRADLVARIYPEMEDRLIGEHDGYQRLRSAVPGLIFERWQALVPVTKMIGGSEFFRHHRGDPDAKSPFVPIPEEREREALALIIDQAFAPGAFEIAPEVLNKLPPNRYSDWTANRNPPVDYPIHGTVGFVQGNLLSQLMHNGRLIRMIDNEVRVADGEGTLTVAELFDELTRGIWTEAGWNGRAARNVDSFRRNLQRAHLEQLVTKLLDRRAGAPSAFNPRTPEDARSLARYELSRL
ncbi:MAG: zinc-dependent metalloprotease, partial [Gemmatimonadota bacterium]